MNPPRNAGGQEHQVAASVPAPRQAAGTPVTAHALVAVILPAPLYKSFASRRASNTAAWMLRLATASPMRNS